jgi:membrane protein implicated in regulation of membrane protease activity
VVVGHSVKHLLPHPWNEAAFSAAFGWEIASILFALWYSQRGRAQVGSETLIGQAALVITACFPTGQVKVGGETWIAAAKQGRASGSGFASAPSTA